MKTTHLLLAAAAICLALAGEATTAQAWDPPAPAVTMQGVPDGLTSRCCPQWSRADILAAIEPTAHDATDATDDRSPFISSEVSARMGSYLDLLNALDPTITTLTIILTVTSLGTASADHAPAALPGTMIGPVQTVTWTWSPSGVTQAKDGWPSNRDLPRGHWIGIQSTLSINGNADGQSLFGPHCASTWSVWLNPLDQDGPQ